MKIGNDYAKVLSGEFMEKCPKTVFAAIAVSLTLTNVNEEFDQVEQALKNEWQRLYENGIVSQKPLK